MGNKYIVIWLVILSVGFILLLRGQGLHNDDYDNSNLKATACDTELFLERTAALKIADNARGNRQTFIRNYLDQITKGDFRAQYDKTFTLREN